MKQLLDQKRFLHAIVDIGGILSAPQRDTIEALNTITAMKFTRVTKAPKYPHVVVHASLPAPGDDEGYFSFVHIDHCGVLTADETDEGHDFPLPLGGEEETGTDKRPAAQERVERESMCVCGHSLYSHREPPRGGGGHAACAGVGVHKCGCTGFTSAELQSSAREAHAILHRPERQNCAGCGHLKETHVGGEGMCRKPDCDCPGFEEEDEDHESNMPTRDEMAGPDGEAPRVLHLKDGEFDVSIKSHPGEHGVTFHMTLRRRSAVWSFKLSPHEFAQVVDLARRNGVVKGESCLPDDGERGEISLDVEPAEDLQDTIGLIDRKPTRADLLGADGSQVLVIGDGVWLRADEALPQTHRLVVDDQGDVQGYWPRLEHLLRALPHKGARKAALDISKRIEASEQGYKHVHGGQPGIHVG